MMVLNRVKLFEAEQSYAVANTASFLLRKLRADPVVKNLQIDYGGRALLDALKLALNKRPKTLGDAVRPYAYLVALSFDLDPSCLHDATKLVAPYAEWYQPIARLLVASRTPVSYATVNVPAQTGQSAHVDAANSSFSSASTEDVH
jgi:hypothetical protein